MNRRNGPYAVVAVAGLALAAAFTPLGFPAPKGDDAVYKSPAAELAQNGRLVIPGLTGWLPRVDEVFASYPPLYPLLLAPWYALFGFSLHTTLAFHYTVHTVSALAIMWVAARLLSAVPELGGDTKRWILIAIGLVHIANLAYFDRQEETALLFLWPLIALPPPRREWIRKVMEGLLIGLAWLTSPWVGLLGGLFVVSRTAVSAVFAGGRERRTSIAGAALELLVIGAVSLAIVGGWVLVMEVFWPGIIRDQFFGTAAVIRETQMTGSIGEKLRVFGKTVLYNPGQLLPTLLTLAFFPVAFWGRRSSEAVSAWGIYLTGLAALAMLLIVRPIAYTYLGATQMFLLPCLAPAITRFAVARSAEDGRARRLITAAILGVAVLSASRDACLWAYVGARMPRDQRAAAVYERLRDEIPPGDSVAVLAPHWHAFQGRNPWREAYFAALVDDEEVRNCRWLVLHPDYGTPAYLDGFERKAESVWNTRIWRPYSYTLWSNRTSAVAEP